jgi:hypothetical protein
VLSRRNLIKLALAGAAAGSAPGLGSPAVRRKQWGFEWGLSPERERQILADWKASGRTHL